MNNPWDPNADDHARFQRELAAQYQKQQYLERNAVAAFAEWVGEIVKQFVKTAVHSFWSWFKGLFG